MDLSKLSAIVVVLYATLCTITSAMSIPSSQLKQDPDQLDDPENALDEGRRASWLETRDLEGDFKDLVLLTLHELVQEGHIDPRVVLDDEPAVGDVKEKRGRWQGFCFRRTKSGRFLPYICWKGGQYEQKERGQGGVIGQRASRSRRQGFCFRRTKSGRFLPYICWKGDRK